MLRRTLLMSTLALTLLGCKHYEPVELITTAVAETTAIVLETEPTKSVQEIKEAEAQARIHEISTIENPMTWFIEYKKILEEYSPWIDAPETIYDVYTSEDIRYMLKCIETETHGQNFIPKVNVANVILNRVASERFPNQPYAVITAPKQFAYGRENVADDTVLALEYAFLTADTTQGALFFHSFKTAIPTFSNAKYIFTDEAGHHFYK